MTTNTERLLVLNADYRADLADSEGELAKAIASNNIQAQRYYEGRVDVLKSILAGLEVQP